MLLADTYLDLSPGRGIGLFAGEAIPIGTKWWERKEEFDKLFLPDQINSLHILTISFIKTYGFLEPTGNWYLCIDNARFSNHSDFPNTANITNHNGELLYCIASRNIPIGHEIFCNYREICRSASQNLGFENVDL